MIGFSTDQGPSLLDIQAVTASLAGAAFSDVLQLRLIANVGPAQRLPRFAIND